MGLFDKWKKEKTKMIDGYEIGIESGAIYRCPKGLTEYYLPNGTKRITSEAVQDMMTARMNSAITKIVIPASFETFNLSNTEYMSLNTKIKENKIKELVFEEGLKFIKLNPECRDKVKYNIPNSVERLGTYGYNLTHDGKLIINDKIIELEKMFASCDKRIKSVEMFGKVKVIPIYAFNQSDNIEKVILHEGIEKAEDFAFRGTNRLKQVKIPSTFSGKFVAPTEKRSQESYKDAEKSYVNIEVSYKGNTYSFNIKRTELELFDINSNKITFNNRISLDMNTLKSDEIYKIVNNNISVEKKNIESNEKQKVNVQDSVNMDTIDLTNVSLGTANSIIHDITKGLGLENLEYEDLEPLSKNDQYILTLALETRRLHLLNSVRKNEKDLSAKIGYKKILEGIENLLDEKIIFPMTKVKSDDKNNNHIISKMFQRRVIETNILASKYPYLLGDEKFMKLYRDNREQADLDSIINSYTASKNNQSGRQR